MASVMVDLQVSANSRWPWSGPGLSVGSSAVSILLSNVPANSPACEGLSEHVTECLDIPAAIQRLQAPRFEELNDDHVMEFVKHDITRGKWFHLDAESLTIFQETDELVDLSSGAPVQILNQHTVHLTILPSPLPQDRGGRIFISYGGKTKQLVVPFVKPTDTIRDLKARVEKVLGVPSASQKLMFGWRELYDDRATVEECGLVQNSIVVLEPKLSEKGGVEAKPYKIFVSLLDGTRMELQVRGCDRVGFVKERIQDAHGTRAADQQIKFRGKNLDDHRMLKDCGVTKEQTLHSMLKLRMVTKKQIAAGNLLRLVVVRDGKEIDKVEVAFKDTDTVADVKLRLRAQHGSLLGTGEAQGGGIAAGGSGGAKEFEELQRKYEKMVEEMARMQKHLSSRGEGSGAHASPTEPQPAAGSSGGWGNQSDARPGIDSAEACMPMEDAVLSERGLRKMEYPPGWKPIFATGVSDDGAPLATAMSDPAVFAVGPERGIDRPNGSPLTPLDFSDLIGARRTSPDGQAESGPADSVAQEPGPFDHYEQLLSRPSTAPSAVSLQASKKVETVGDSILRKYLQEASISDLD
ncbi:ubiquitin C [Klebsormidium nitens]|uniref:Ubiquitin C n=1 Tax=Klebsormidium nitens TaxID=105231 RepID=A0A1Y1HUT5_KLENI|nr:ubiquitin C [Klebsormidium nitens]|eukprot:GAQ81903.1 ubiquitin C [Klebsormidium nitens]